MNHSADPKRPRPAKIRLGLPAFLVMLVAAMPASATEFCIVQESPDGFVALRATPSADGKLLVRTKAGEAVVIQKSASGDQIVSGRWLRVLHFPDSVVPQKSDPQYKRGRLGWMHSRYIDECG